MIRNALADLASTTADNGLYALTRHSKNRRPLNLRRLLALGAFRVTYEADGNGGYLTNNDPSSFTIVAAVNDAAKGSFSTRAWPNKASSVGQAIRLMSDCWLDDGKYWQIVDSAVAMRLNPQDIFTDD